MADGVYDAIIIGGGAAGLFCAATAGRRGRRVLLIEHAEKVGKKILISGGGRCNFTNREVSHKNYISENPRFCISAISRFTPSDFISLASRYHIAYHEKKLGQLFCNGSSKQIANMLVRECDVANVEIKTNCSIAKIERSENSFICESSEGSYHSDSLVIATGGISVPAIGATDFAYRLAKQFDIAVIPMRPALVPLIFDRDSWGFSQLSGVSLEVIISNDIAEFRDDLLFTHKGLSGPAILQISSYWREGEMLRINLLPDISKDMFLSEKNIKKLEIKNALAEYMPKRLSDIFCERMELRGNVSALSAESSKSLYESLTNWQIKPQGTAGFHKAEVTAGGIDTRELSSKTMECNKQKGLYFVGEAVDVTGWLGGYNFQWAWASGYAAGLVC